MAGREDVGRFLSEFQQMARVFDLLVINRIKNFDGLKKLEITASIRKEVILSLTEENYYRGPTVDQDRPEFEIWEFGTEIDAGKEVYIKLSRRRENKKPICISFHPPEFEMTYKFKPTKP